MESRIQPASEYRDLDFKLSVRYPHCHHLRFGGHLARNTMARDTINPV